MLAIDVRETLVQRAHQFAYKVREIYRHAKEIVDRIDADNLELVRLSELQDSLWAQKTEIANWPFGSLTSLEVRQEVARQWPHVYATAADVQTQIQAANALFNSLTASISSTLTASDAVRQRVSNDPITGQRVFNKVPASDAAALRTAAQSVVAFMSGAAT